MPRNRVSSSEISVAILKNLQYQTTEIQKSVAKATRSVATNTKKVIQQEAPVRRGNYRKSWAIKKNSPSSYTVYSKKYPLTHLLENGHILRNGKTSKPFKHISKGEEYAQSELPKQIEKILKDNAK